MTNQSTPTIRSKANLVPRTKEEIAMYRAGWKDALENEKFKRSFKQRLHRLLVRLHLRGGGVWIQPEISLAVPKGKWKITPNVVADIDQPMFVTLEKEAAPINSKEDV